MGILWREVARIAKASILSHLFLHVEAIVTQNLTLELRVCNYLGIAGERNGCFTQLAGDFHFRSDEAREGFLLLRRECVEVAICNNFFAIPTDTGFVILSSSISA